ncbi:hypothetical protein ACSBR2_011979 [Camellia fascicularis]
MELSARSSQQWSPNAFVADGGGAKLQCQDVGGRDGTLCWGGKWEQSELMRAVEEDIGGGGRRWRSADEKIGGDRRWRSTRSSPVRDQVRELRVRDRRWRLTRSSHWRSTSEREERELRE